MSGRPDAGNLRGRRERLRVRRLDLEMLHPAVVFGNGAGRSVLADVYEQLHVGPDRVRVGGSCEVHAGEQRLLGVRDARGVRVTSDVHGRGGVVGVHVQHRSGVQRRGQGVHERVGAGDVRRRFAGVLLRVHVVDVSGQPDVSERGVRGHVRARSGQLQWPAAANMRHQWPVAEQGHGVRIEPDVRQWGVRGCLWTGASHVQRLATAELRNQRAVAEYRLVMQQCDRVVLLQCNLQGAAELRGERSRIVQLRRQQRELLHEPGGPGRHLLPDVHEQRRRARPGEADPATVSGFRLDKYDVTVGRFRQFVSRAGTAGRLHAAGGLGQAHAPERRPRAGEQRQARATYEPGWVASDDGNIAPTDANLAPAAIRQHLRDVDGAAGSNENLPINCVNWYEAYAFCIWDGGFLPSEAEWEYAAAGGSQQREYPWGSTAPGTANQYAIYGLLLSERLAGLQRASRTSRPWGRRRWARGSGVSSIWPATCQQWTLDWYATYVESLHRLRLYGSGYRPCRSARAAPGIPRTCRSCSPRSATRLRQRLAASTRLPLRQDSLAPGCPRVDRFGDSARNGRIGRGDDGRRRRVRASAVDALGALRHAAAVVVHGALVVERRARRGLRAAQSCSRSTLRSTGRRSGSSTRSARRGRRPSTRASCRRGSPGPAGRTRGGSCRSRARRSDRRRRPRASWSSGSRSG